MTTNNQNELFPPPSRPLYAASPTIWAGSTPELLRVVQDVLQDNHKRWHAFFNDRGFHNHTAHHILALWAFGVNKDVIEAAYEEDKLIQRPAFSSPEPITMANFNEHLGDENYYNAYLLFFCDIVTKRDIGSVLEEFVFSSKVNFGSKSNSGQRPEMLNRFLGGLIHPFIHTGYGVEFQIPGLIAEGLAQTAVHSASNTVLIPPSVFPNDRVPSVGKLTSFIHSVKLSNSTSAGAAGDTHALNVLARIMKDPELKVTKAEETNLFASVIEKNGDAIFKYANSWSLDTSNPKEVERKIEELQWMNVLIYAIAGFKAGKGNFNADFFYMHLVTTSIFLPTLTAYLCPASQEALLRAYFAVCLSVYVARGCPDLDVEAFFDANIVGPRTNTNAFDTSPILKLPPTSPSVTSSPNPWFPIIHQTILHPDDHLCKLQRTLAHYSTLYGWKSAGSFSEKQTELPGANKIDGTLFIRAAGLTALRLGRDFGGEKLLSYWDRDGFYQHLAAL
ncbi:hypothetical protein GYMLUDRAFT_35785 [Collybiopsis luxurians FD-317 M1]|nr:hypothetical protein GYMLUDRAFT_35785 [Collybiopsis luxurians FD-317 M1]